MNSDYQRFSRRMIEQMCRNLGVPASLIFGDGGTHYTARSRELSMQSIEAMGQTLMASASYREAARVADVVMAQFMFMFGIPRRRQKRRPQISSRRMNTAKRLARRKMNRFNKRRSSFHG